MDVTHTTKGVECPPIQLVDARSLNGGRRVGAMRTAADRERTAAGGRAHGTAAKSVGPAGDRAHARTGPGFGLRPAPPGLVFATVAALLLSAGWAANHFASVLVVLRDQQNYS